MLLLLLACADPCARSVRAASVCITEAGEDPGVWDVDTLCAEAHPGWEDWYDCQAEAWSGADCSTDTGFAAAAVAAASCPPPEPSSGDPARR